MDHALYFSSIYVQLWARNSKPLSELPVINLNYHNNIGSPIFKHCALSQLRNAEVILKYIKKQKKMSSIKCPAASLHRVVRHAVPIIIIPRRSHRAGGSGL